MQGIDCVCFAGGIPVHPRSALYDLVSKRNVDGLIVGPVMYTMGEREIDASFNRFGDVPLVAVDYIAKPFHAEESRLRIESILRNRKLQSDRGLKTMKTRMQTTLDRMMLDDKPADRRAAIPVIGSRYSSSWTGLPKRNSSIS